MKRLMILAALALTACAGSQGKVTVMLTDAPGDFKAAVVTITRINLVGSGGVTPLSTTEVTTDLLNLDNEVMKLVENVDVPVGTYTELSIVISGGYIEVVNSDNTTTSIYATTGYPVPNGAKVAGELRMPSYAQSGLKVSLPGGNVDVTTESKILLVDFDVKQSFGHDAGGSGAWVMHPVMTATDFGLSGTLNVTAKLDSSVTLPAGTTLASFNAVATNSAGSAKTLPLGPTAQGSATYGASFKYLIPGQWTVSFANVNTTSTTQFKTTTPSTPQSVTVASGAATQADYTVNAIQ